MRLLILVALAFLLIALICAAVPTTLADDGWPFWFILGVFTATLDSAIGGWTIPITSGRPPS